APQPQGRRPRAGRPPYRPRADGPSGDDDPMRIVFAGTPDFAVPSLRVAAQRGEVAAVYTQPDRPAGRGRGLQASPVKLEAIGRGIPVFQPESLRDPAAQEQLRALKPDLMVVVAYGLILPKAVLARSEEHTSELQSREKL